jgi:RNA polymerase sigma-70 factor (ECF subfamily)
VPAQPDHDLVRAAQADPARFAPLYDRYFGDVFRFLLRRAGDRELTADLTQQAFLKAMLSLSRYESRGLPFRAWLYRIALNELRMHWRKRKEVLLDLSYQQVDGLRQEMDLRLDPDDMTRVAQALSALDEARAQLIHLRFMDGLSYLEVGQVLGIGEDAAKMRTHRVLAALRANLAKRP